MRILFAGTPEIAVPALKALAADHDVAAVLTNPDRIQGRGRKVHSSEVKQAADELGLTVLQPQKLDADFRGIIAGMGIDLLVCIAYGKIFSQAFLDLFPRGGINFHPSRLPDFRGPSPLNAQILRGDTLGAITVQALAKAMDSGDILLQENMPLDERETAATLSEKAARMAGECLLKVLSAMEGGTLVPRPQDHDKATFCSLIGKNDGLMDWSQSAVRLDRIVRAYTPWPHGFTFWKGLRLNILEAAPYDGTAPVAADSLPGTVAGLDKKEGILVQTGDGVLALKRLQLQSKKALDFKSFLNGSKDFTGSVLGEEHDL
jgi:methionyl-tRNA formyltransferase